MSDKTEKMFRNALSKALSSSMHQQTLLSDEACLEVMRGIIKEYLNYRQSTDEHDLDMVYRNRYEEYRQRVQDDALRAYTAFEFMEKLYWQEYLSNKG
jgi:hypothetical protein